MTATIPDIEEAIYARFKASVPGSITYTFDNEAFITPETDPWVRFSIRPTSSTQETLGQPTNREFLRRGIVVMQLFTLAGSGVQLSNTLAEALRTIFEGVSFSDIRFTDCNARKIGTDGKWYQVNVEADFDYNQQK